jgi:hypothetical protein
MKSQILNCVIKILYLIVGEIEIALVYFVSGFAGHFEGIFWGH